MANSQSNALKFISFDCIAECINENTTKYDELFFPVSLPVDNECVGWVYCCATYD